jgi:O-antigen/teichoic acid export membrane protein
LHKSRLILFISCIGMLTSLILNFILVPQMGAKGAAITCIITYSVMAATCYFFVYKYVIKQKDLTT